MGLRLFRVAASAFSIAGFMGSVAAAQTASDGVVLSTQADIAAALANVTNGIATYPAPTDKSAIAILAHREKDGGVEVHDVLNDLLVGREGSAMLLVGGRHVDGREATPGERRSGRIEGGRRITMGPGDMVWIPAGVPHQMFMIDGGSVTYLALKFQALPKAGPAPKP